MAILLHPQSVVRHSSRGRGKKGRSTTLIECTRKSILCHDTSVCLTQGRRSFYPILLADHLLCLSLSRRCLLGAVATLLHFFYSTLIHSLHTTDLSLSASTMGMTSGHAARRSTKSTRGRPPTTSRGTLGTSSGGKRKHQSPTRSDMELLERHASMPGSTYKPSCNAFEHMTTLKDTIDHWKSEFDKYHPTLTDAQKDGLSTWIKQTEIYAGSPKEATIDIDLSRVTHTALKKMSRLYRSAGFTEGAEGIRSTYDQHDERA